VLWVRLSDDDGIACVEVHVICGRLREDVESYYDNVIVFDFLLFEQCVCLFVDGFGF